MSGVAMATAPGTCYPVAMSKTQNDSEALTRDVPSRAESGYAEWLRTQLEQAVADLDDPDRVEIEHDRVFAELDRLIAEHEKR